MLENESTVLSYTSFSAWKPTREGGVLAGLPHVILSNRVVESTVRPCASNWSVRSHPAEAGKRQKYSCSTSATPNSQARLESGRVGPQLFVRHPSFRTLTKREKENYEVENLFCVLYRGQKSCALPQRRSRGSERQQRLKPLECGLTLI